MIPVTKPFLPPIHEYEQYVREIWGRNWLTNNGPLVQDLERKLKERLELNNVLFVTNGTIAIQMAIKALNLSGRIITTPFSYVATTSSIVWENCEPVFVDIDPDTCNIDAGKIEAAITPDVSAILATHVYGNPCDVERIAKIASARNLKVIYDGAHAFGVKYKQRSIFEWGDISTCSFHATKLFHTIEGGMVVTDNDNLSKKLGYLRNFGHDGFDKFSMLGVNGKNSEFHAAMGLVNLSYVDSILDTRRRLSELYDDGLAGVNIRKPIVGSDVRYNYAYKPVIFESEEMLLRVFTALNENGISPRRYFYPSLETLPYVRPNIACHHAQSIAARVLCLPLYDTLTEGEVAQICGIIQKALN